VALNFLPPSRPTKCAPQPWRDVLAIDVGIEVVARLEHEDAQAALGERERSPAARRPGADDDGVVRIGCAQIEVNLPPALTLVLITTPTNALLFFGNRCMCSPAQSEFTLPPALIFDLTVIASSGLRFFVVRFMSALPRNQIELILP
jgi:hypothetical protein